MAEEVKITIDVEAGKGGKTVKGFKKDLEGAAQEGKKVSDSIKKVGTESLSVKKQLKVLKDQMSEIGDIGSPKFQQLAKEAGVLKDKMNNANSAIKSMSSDFPKLQVGIQAMQGIGAAAQFAAGAQLLLGSENKELQKAMQRAMALTTMMSSVQALANLLSDEAMLGQKLRTTGLWKHMVAMKAFVARVKLAIGWQKALNFVMKANPIGLLITAITLLIGAWALFGDGVKKVGDFFVWIKDLMVGVFSDMLMFFGLTDAAIETQSMKNRKAAAERKAQHEELSRQNTERLKDLKAEQEALEEKHKKDQEGFDLEIQINKLLGKSSRALTQQKLDDELAFSQEQARIIAEMIASWTKYYEDLFVLSGKSREDFIAQMKGQGIDLEALLDEATQLQVEADNAIRLSEAKLIDFSLKGSKKKAETKVKAEKDSNKKVIDLRSKFLAELEKAENEHLDSLLDAQVREENAVRDKYFNLIEQAIQFGEDTAILEEAQQTQLKEIRDKFAEEARAEQESLNKEAADKKEAQLESAFSSAEALLSAADSLNTIFHGKELKRIEEKKARGEKLSTSEEKRLSKEAKIQKAFALAQIAIDTARAIAGAVAAGSAIPFPGNIPAIIAGVAAVLSNVAAASELINAPTPSISGGSGDIAQASEQASESAPTQALTEGSTLLNQEPQQVVVVESITDGINSVGVIESQASFG